MDIGIPVMGYTRAHELDRYTSLNSGTSLAVGSNYVDKVVVTFWVSAEATLFGLFQFREVPFKMMVFASFLAKWRVGVIRTKRYKIRDAIYRNTRILARRILV
jgi:hypothetical protein